MAQINLFAMKNGKATITKMKDNENPGIYLIYSPNDSIYIGQTNILNRRYIDYIRRSCKSQIKLYNSLSKYGVENHNYIVLHELPKDVSQEILDDYELLYWKLYKDCKFKMMNLRVPGKGGKMSEESKRKMSLSKIGWDRKSSVTQEFIEKMTLVNLAKAKKGSNHYLAKKVYQYTLNQDFIKEWNSVADAARGIGNINSSSSICRAAKNPNKKIIFKDSFWSYIKLNSYND